MRIEFRRDCLDRFDAGDERIRELLKPCPPDSPFAACQRHAVDRDQIVTRIESANGDALVYVPVLRRI